MSIAEEGDACTERAKQQRGHFKREGRRHLVIVQGAANSQFNIIDFGSTWKVDLIFQKQRDFSRVEFERRLPHVIQGVRVYVASPEDILIAKLERAKIGESERQIEDAAGVIATQGDDLDRKYVERWIEELDLHEQWRRASELAG
jgi:hypothetical protein